MESINIDVRLRPLRLGFVTRPDDEKTLFEIFRINTCLWGGQYNPIIPFFERVPRWWERKGINFDNARQIFNGYLDFFEPDIVVESEKGIAAGSHLDTKRIIQPQNILPKEGSNFSDRGVGLCVLPLYRKMYREEFQFVRRHRHSIVNVVAKDRSFSLFAACIFGAFPNQRNLSYLEKSFNDAFDPEPITLEVSTLEKLYRQNYSSALAIGSAKCSVDFHVRNDPLLFIIDANEPRDLIDFWNYRAIHRDVLAVPVQWLEGLSGFCKTFIASNYRPLPNNSFGVMIRTTLMFSRSIKDTDIAILYEKYLKSDKPDSVYIQTWYPSIWRPAPEFVVRTVRPTLEADSKSYYLGVDVEKPTVRFESLSPEFADKYGGEYRWANVVRLRDWSFKDRLATTFPCDFRKSAIPHLCTGGGFLLSSTEGLVTFSRYKDVPNSWNLCDGSTAIDAWLKENKIEIISVSESGRVTEQIVQTLGGFGGVRAIANKGIVELLNGMARKPITRSAHRHEFENKVNTAIGKDIWRGRTFATLVERKAVELGYELKCSKCGNWSWYAVSQLKSIVTCELCLRPFSFPVTDPSNSTLARWAYRVIGPFALPDYANGGYASALAIRFFSDVVGTIDRADVTWTSGRKLHLPTGKDVEADFALWFQRKQMFGTDIPTEIVFGEAKSLGREAFQEEDIERLKALAIAFPGAVLALATMKQAEELSVKEIRLIKRLAEWGREYDRDRRQSRAPVLMLTGTELFTPYHLQKQWKDRGGRHAALIEAAYISARLDNLRILADLTQQLYLGMPSYGDWRQKRWNKRRRQKLGAVASAASNLN